MVEKCINYHLSSIMLQIRLTKTPEIKKVLDQLHQQYPLLNDAEIIKFSLSIAYQQMRSDNNYWLTDEEEEGVGISLKQLEEGKGFKGSAEEVIEWLNK